MTKREWMVVAWRINRTLDELRMAAATVSGGGPAETAVADHLRIAFEALTAARSEATREIPTARVE